MKATKTQKWMLFTLGCWHEEARKQLEGKPVQAAVTKSVFIDFLLGIKLASKQKRSLYKNLEVLGKRRWISYENKELMLTQNGERQYQKILREIAPYISIKKQLTTHHVLRHTRKVQTILK